MERDKLSTDKFIARVFSTAAANDIITSYRLSPEKLQLMLANTFKEMGIFVVSPRHANYLMRFVLDRLQHDPQILHAAQMARLREATRTRNRHSE